jgi:DNA-binding transcriptional LysR family regulator
MGRVFDVDVLRTFVAIAEHGSFTRAADAVHKTQSAVSMQMKRLEDMVQKPLFARSGRNNRLTVHGDHLLEYARRMVQINNEALTALGEPELSGLVRIGTPDDYADRFLPEILARFARTHPMIKVDVECQSSTQLQAKVKTCELDLAIVTCEENMARGDVVRVEPLIWVTSAQHDVHEHEVLPVALSQQGCTWRQMALNALDKTGRAYRIAYVSANSMAVSAAVMSGLAVAAIPELVLRPGMRVLSPEEGFPLLGSFTIELLRASSELSSAGDALAEHMMESLSNFPRRPIAAE